MLAALALLAAKPVPAAEGIDVSKLSCKQFAQILIECEANPDKRVLEVSGRLNPRADRLSARFLAFFAADMI